MSNFILENWKKFLKEEDDKGSTGSARVVMLCPDYNSILLLRNRDSQKLETLRGAPLDPVEAISYAKQELGLDMKGLDENKISNETIYTWAGHDESSCSLASSSLYDGWAWLILSDIEDAVKNGRGSMIVSKIADSFGNIKSEKLEISDKLLVLLEKLRLID